VLTLDLCVRNEKRHTKSSHTKSSVVAQSTNPEISCSPSRFFTFSSARYSGRAAVRTVNMAKASVGTCRDAAMDDLDSSGGTSSGGGSTSVVCCRGSIVEFTINVDQPQLNWPWSKCHDLLLGRVVHRLASKQLSPCIELLVRFQVSIKVVELSQLT
jgi:hypothetical protein